MTEVYGTLENVKIITLAPEKSRAMEVIRKLSDDGITVSVGHSMANLCDGEAAVAHGANLITHLFNAMLPVTVQDFRTIFKLNARFIFAIVPPPRSGPGRLAHVQRRTGG